MTTAFTRWALACTLTLGFTSTAHADCADVAAPCTIDLGTYHIALPDGDGPYPALVFLHGAGSNGQSSVRMVRAALARGYAVIGPDGLRRENRGAGWSFHPLFPEARDEAAFIRAIIDDAAANHGIDHNRVILGGFSIGGSMTSYIACFDPDVAQAYAPVGGSFWRPHPELTDCTAPVRVFHTHGWRDKVVPLEGRQLGGGRIVQGDVFHAMRIWRETNGCDVLHAEEFETDEGFWVRRWTTCTDGALEFVLHPGGHGIPQGWTNMALDWFEASQP